MWSLTVGMMVVQILIVASADPEANLSPVAFKEMLSTPPVCPLHSYKIEWLLSVWLYSHAKIDLSNAPESNVPLSPKFVEEVEYWLDTTLSMINKVDCMLFAVNVQRPDGLTIGCEPLNGLDGSVVSCQDLGALCLLVPKTNMIVVRSCQESSRVVCLNSADPVVVLV